MTNIRFVFFVFFHFLFHVWRNMISVIWENVKNTKCSLPSTIYVVFAKIDSQESNWILVQIKMGSTILDV